MRIRAGEKTFYVYGIGLIGQEKNGAYRSFHYDFRGSTVIMTDEVGKITHQYAYTAYGTVDAVQEEAFNPFRYVGQYGVMYEGNGLYYMRARYYQPELRRFLGEDPIWNKNLFAYVEGNPLVGIDPSGLIVDFIYMGHHWTEARKYQKLAQKASERAIFHAKEIQNLKAERRLINYPPLQRVVDKVIQQEENKARSARREMSMHQSLMLHHFELGEDLSRNSAATYGAMAAGLSLFGGVLPASIALPARPTAVTMFCSGASNSIVEEGYGNGNWTKAGTGVLESAATSWLGYKFSSPSNKLGPVTEVLGNYGIGLNVSNVRSSIDYFLDYSDKKSSQTFQQDILKNFRYFY